MLLDICCGSGLYCIALSKFVKRIIGVEINREAVADAKFNASLNQVTNVEFITGLVEDIVPKILESLPQNSQVVAIVNPSRYGIMSSLLSALRRCKNLRKLVYVSCNPFGKSAYNFYNLCRPPNLLYENLPFQITRAVPVDLFPQTAHTELVLLFER